MSKIVCFGEVLWDVFPTHKKIGGAPLNVALRLNSFKNNVSIISSVGDDFDGKKLIQYIEDNDLDIKNIQISDRFNTSQVTITLDNSGSASYVIEHPCSWDYITFQKSSKVIVKQSDVFIFGSLAARTDVSRNTLFKLIKVAKFKVFDVNLRAPHYDMLVINKLMDNADFIKFNDEELVKICNYHNFKSSDLKDSIKFISNKTNTEQICVTLGDKGALLYANKQFFKNSGFKVTAKDTVGAGDSFLAALISNLLNNKSHQTSINYACAVGALVASKNGANPKITIKEITALMHKS